MTSIRYATCVAALFSSCLVAQETQTKTAPTGATYLREAAITQTANTIHIAANSPRPLTQVLDALRQKYSWLVDYEDPRYLSKSDIVERTTPNTAAHLFPAGGGFDVDVPTGTPATAPPPEEKTLQLIVDAYNQSKNPGRFELRKNEDGSFAIVGVGEQNESGKTVPQEAPLDLSITLPKHQTSASETVQLICQKISEHIRTQITVGVTPRKLMDHKDVDVSGAKVQARTFLSRTLAATGNPIYWRLLYDPGSKGYFLDVHAVVRDNK